MPAGVVNVPSVPEPFFTALHALQSVLQTELQQTPSTHAPGATHSPFCEHGAPIGNEQDAHRLERMTMMEGREKA